MNFIKFDFPQFLKDYIPIKLRTSFNFDFFNVLLSQSIKRYKQLLVIRDEMLFDVKHNGQVGSLVHYLNNKINVLGKPIKISKTGNIPQWYVGTDIEQEPPLILDFYSRNGEEIEYQINKPYIATTSELTNADPSYIMYVGTDDTIATDTVDFIVYVDSIDLTDIKKVELITYYVTKYKLAGSSFQIKSY